MFKKGDLAVAKLPEDHCDYDGLNGVIVSITRYSISRDIYYGNCVRLTDENRQHWAELGSNYYFSSKHLERAT